MPKQQKEEELPVLLKLSAVKTLLKEQGFRVSGDFPEALNRNLHRTLKWAMRRAKGNKRETIRPIDAL